MVAEFGWKALRLGGLSPRIDNCYKLLNPSSMSKVITSHFEQVIERFIASGRFNNKSEVIRAGLRLLEEHELHFERAARADLERILDEDLEEAEPATPAEQLFTRRKH